jgi:hypothetical protein
VKVAADKAAAEKAAAEKAAAEKAAAERVAVAAAAKKVQELLLYMCPHTAMFVSTDCDMCPNTNRYVFAYRYICVPIPHTTTYGYSHLILLHICVLTTHTTYVSSCYHIGVRIGMCPHTSYYYIYVLMLPHRCPHRYVSSHLILLHVCPHATTEVSASVAGAAKELENAEILLHICVRICSSTTDVSSCYYICVLIGGQGPRERRNCREKSVGKGDCRSRGRWR